VGDPIPGSAEYEAENDSEEGNKNSKAGSRKMESREEGVVTEIFDMLSDAVANAIIRRIAETGECSRKDLETLDAVEKEGESVIRELREYGLIEVEKDTIALTEKGRKVLAFIDELDKKLTEG
jgi:predicted methyltransferase